MDPWENERECRCIRSSNILFASSGPRRLDRFSLGLFFRTALLDACQGYRRIFCSTCFPGCRSIQLRPSTIISMAQDESTSWLFVVGVPGQQPEYLRRAWGVEPGWNRWSYSEREPTGRNIQWSNSLSDRSVCAISILRPPDPQPPKLFHCGQSPNFFYGSSWCITFLDALPQLFLFPKGNSALRSSPATLDPCWIASQMHVEWRTCCRDQKWRSRLKIGFW